MKYLTTGFIEKRYAIGFEYDDFHWFSLLMCLKLILFKKFRYWYLYEQYQHYFEPTFKTMFIKFNYHWAFSDFKNLFKKKSIEEDLPF